VGTFFLVNFPLQQNFFGLTSEYKKNILYEFYILIKHGNFSYGDILNMPIYERRTFIEILMDEADKANKKREEAVNKMKSNRR
jgi:phosphoribosylformylglycinamidine (FGAM) synthase-like amidotransferase family enzyme